MILIIFQYCYLLQYSVIQLWCLKNSFVETTDFLFSSTLFSVWNIPWYALNLCLSFRWDVLKYYYQQSLCFIHEVAHVHATCNAQGFHFDYESMVGTRGRVHTALCSPCVLVSAKTMLIAHQCLVVAECTPGARLGHLAGKRCCIYSMRQATLQAVLGHRSNMSDLMSNQTLKCSNGINLSMLKDIAVIHRKE